VTALPTSRWTALGTTASVAVCDPLALRSASVAVEFELAQIDLSCSRFREDSDLSHLNAMAGRPMSVGPLLFEAIVVALRAAELTDGAVDPTIGEALFLIGYDRDFSLGLREPAHPLSARRVIGWRSISVDRARRRVSLPRGVRLDLGATAKALAADRAATAAAEATGGSGVLVNLGGDIAVAGAPPPGGWPVRVTDDHRSLPNATGQSLTIDSGGLATSSTTVRRWGRASHHIIDPQTGRPSESRWRTVSVAAGSSVDANTASTAAIVRGDDAPNWLEAHGMPARLVDREGEVLTVASWPKELVAA
jgi:thiamine biosynthesis lipoprotein